MNSTQDKRIPVTVITGYLGSGKTTLLNRLLQARKDSNILVVMNEYGEIDIDGKLLYSGEEQLVEFNNGCLCCTVRQDLVRMLTEAASSDCDGVLIETTGLADPAPVASTFFVIPEVRDRYRLDSFITVVDAYNISESLKDSHEAMEQVSFADILVLNKIDAIDEKQRNFLEERIRTMNPTAELYAVTNCDVDPEKMLNVDAFHLEAKLKVDAGFLDDVPHEHDNSITSLVLTDDRPIDVTYFQAYIADILNRQSMQILRSKGVFYASRSQDTKMVFQTVRMLSAIEKGDPWEANEAKKTEYVVIGRNLNRDELQRAMNLSARKLRAKSTS